MGNKERNTSSSRCSTGCRYIVAACPSMDSRKQGLPKTELHLIWQSGGSWRGQRYIALFACACVKDPAATTTTTTFVPTHAAGPNLLCGRPRRFIRERKRCCKGLHDTRDVGGRKKKSAQRSKERIISQSLLFHAVQLSLLLHLRLWCYFHFVVVWSSQRNQGTKLHKRSVVLHYIQFGCRVDRWGIADNSGGRCGRRSPEGNSFRFFIYFICPDVQPTGASTSHAEFSLLHFLLFVDQLFLGVVVSLGEILPPRYFFLSIF